MDALLGIKYKLSNTDLSDKEYLEYVDKVDNYYIYKNNYALSLGIKTNGQIDLDLTQDPFTIQNEIFENLTGEKNLFSECTLISKKEEKLKLEGTYYSGINRESKIICKYDVSSVEEDVYLYIDTDYNWDESCFKVLVNGEVYQDKYIGANKNGILTIDNEVFKGQKEIEIEFDFINDKDLEIRKIYLEQMNVAKFKFTMEEKLEEEELTNIEENGESITVSMLLEDKSYATLTIPYDEAWEITVNGERREYEKTQGDFIGIELNKGENEIEMRYIPKGLRVGSMISIFCIAILGIFLIVKKHSAI